MSENLKTIKELADELGVSKQNLQYHVKFLPTKKSKKTKYKKLKKKLYQVE
ncbi:hypothetical protein [Lactococcus cremoris]|uniref:hypothetical protein n=1 Tax=Lactococcus lactis subsp. cremoris TaxID=1359 RepID=UPI002FC9E8B8